MPTFRLVDGDIVDIDFTGTRLVHGEQLEGQSNPGSPHPIQALDNQYAVVMAASLNGVLQT